MARLTKEEVKERVCRAIEDAAPELKKIAASIMAEPELGYKEDKTSSEVQRAFDAMGGTWPYRFKGAS